MWEAVKAIVDFIQLHFHQASVFLQYCPRGRFEPNIDWLIYPSLCKLDDVNASGMCHVLQWCSIICLCYDHLFLLVA